MFALNLKFFITLLWVSVAAKLLIIWGIGKYLKTTLLNMYAADSPLP